VTTQSVVFDASALLALLQNEPGAQLVIDRIAIGRPGFVSAVNWSEIMQKALYRQHNWQHIRGRLLALDITVIEVTRDDAEAAAQLWQPKQGLSLADRLCLTLGQRLNAEILTADNAWSGLSGVTVIR
jgi:PIN domain nuclease of toxin-antitoxin system